MADIHVLPGVERRDLVGAPADSAAVLQGAIDNGVVDVIIVGRDRRGELYISGAPTDVDRVVGMLMRAVGILAQCRMDNDVVITSPPGNPA